MSSDTLSDVLRAVRLGGAVYFDVDASAPWVAEAPPAAVIAPRVMPGAQRVIEFHAVTAGRCYGGLVGEPPLRLEAGDLILFPQGDPHVMSSEPGLRGDPTMPERPPPGTQLPLLMDIGGGGAERTRVICGFIGCDARPFNPLLEALPRVIHVRREAGSSARIDLFMQLALAESGERRPGSECVLARLSELMFVDVIRRYIESCAPATGWIAGLKDEHVGRALARLHERPAHPWSLEALAREAGLSRSALADRFVALVGHGPIGYLTRWRMQLASALLASCERTMADIAAEVGYGSEAAFSRAFKKVVGVPPSRWREPAPGAAR